MFYLIVYTVLAFGLSMAFKRGRFKKLAVVKFHLTTLYHFPSKEDCVLNGSFNIQFLSEWEVSEGM